MRRLGLSALFCLALSWAGAQSPTSSPETPTRPPQSLAEIGSALVQDSLMLTAQLEERKKQTSEQVANWQAIVEALKSEIAQGKQDSAILSDKLAKAETELAKSQADLTEISRLLEASQIDLVSLRKDFDDYKRNIKAELWATRIAAAVFALAAAYFAIKD